MFRRKEPLKRRQKVKRPENISVFSGLASGDRYTMTDTLRLAIRLPDRLPGL